MCSSRECPRNFRRHTCKEQCFWFFRTFLRTAKQRKVNDEGKRDQVLRSAFVSDICNPTLGAWRGQIYSVLGDRNPVEGRSHLSTLFHPFTPARLSVVRSATVDQRILKKRNGACYNEASWGFRAVQRRHHRYAQYAVGGWETITPR